MNWNWVFFAIAVSNIFTGLLYGNSPFEIIMSIVVVGLVWMVYNLVKDQKSFIENIKRRLSI